jgi:signal transduction histidine kinase
MRGYSPAADALRWVAGEAGIVREALRSDLLPIEDVGTDPRLTPAFREMLEAEAIGSLLSAPIRVADQVFGLFLVGFAEPRLFDEAECRLLLALAGRAGLAIQNARLYEQAQQAAALQERQRLARELHDAVTQTLFSASLIAEVTPRLWERAPDEGRRRLEELRSLTRGALAEMRTLLLELRPGALLETPLSHLLRQLAEATASRAKLAIAVRADGEPKLPPEVQVALYRIAQEALNNTVKHAGATQATLSLEAGSGGGVRLHIVDDGRGFDAAAGAVPAGHLGLGIMRERAQAIGARLELTSQPGGGTRVAVHWPASYPA